MASDKVLTVSPNYAAEIGSGPDKGVELDSYIRAAGGAEGIVNGMDVTEWNPKTDKFLTVKYDVKNVFEGKAAAKAALQAELGLPVDPSVPLFGYIGRLEEQKGVDILLAVSDSERKCNSES
jgi:granule-bound starch synthase